MLTKKLLMLTAVSFFSTYLFAQVSVLKMIGNDAGRSKLGYGILLDFTVPVNEAGNKHVVLELLDAAYFPPKQSRDKALLAYISIKAGYRNVFSSEGNTGFFLEPQAGYCRVVRYGETKASYGDGVAVALVGGYSFEVGERGNSIVLGLKYERDMAGKNHTLQAVGFRALFSFSVRKRNDF